MKRSKLLEIQGVLVKANHSNLAKELKVKASKPLTEKESVKRELFKAIKSRLPGKGKELIGKLEKRIQKIKDLVKASRSLKYSASNLNKLESFEDRIPFIK